MFSTDNSDDSQSSNDGEYTNITLHDHFIDNILQVVKVMEMLLVGLLTQRRAVVISIAIVKQLKRSHFLQLKKKLNSLIDVKWDIT